MPDAGGSIVKRLKELGISRLDYVVYSHDPDFFTDSVTIALPDYKAALARRHLEPVMLWDGMSFDIGAVHVQVLGPPRDFPTNFHDDQKWMASKYGVEVYPSSKTISVPMTNDSSICLKFAWGKSVFLICGDLSYSGEKMTLSPHEEDLKTTLAKVNHHGNYTSSIPEWIKAVRPQAVVAMKDKDPAIIASEQRDSCDAR